MKILMVTAEAVPFAKSGGLADMVSALSIALHKAGHDVRIVMPRYYAIDRAKAKKLEGPLGVPLGNQEIWTAVYETVMPGAEGLPVYFIDHEESFGRDGIYGVPGGSDFPDNPARFSVLCNGAFQLCHKIDWIPEIIHAHDWPTALATVLLKFREESRGFAKTAGVFTIHNMGYQGVYPKSFYPLLGVGWEHFLAAGFEDWNRINFLKAGLSSAQMLTTVSPTYAQEICTFEGGFGMDGILRDRGEDLAGILNGVDIEVWNPEKDTYLPKNYTSRTFKVGKAANKAVLQHTMGLDIRDDVPLISMITRLVDQKGIAEVFAPAYGCLYQICADLGVQFVVLGSGEAWCEAEIRNLEGKLPNFRAMLGYNETLSHLIEAGSDMFLMPSRYEPCGLNQMYSLIYGTLPIVRRTGGLADTVKQYNEETREGTGFMFDFLTPKSVFDTVAWGVYTWRNSRLKFATMQSRAIKARQQFGWDIAAGKYLDVYRKALEKKA
ncbi:MAG: glycogen synthase [Spirochaetaceae bacterium]|jgi:starch synthase|nr:glycogen synthase [Spirochaetaceae bacterium]